MKHCLHTVHLIGINRRPEEAINHIAEGFCLKKVTKMSFRYGGQIATTPVDRKVRPADEANGVRGGEIGLAYGVVRKTGNERRLRVRGKLDLCFCRNVCALSTTSRPADYFRLQPTCKDFNVKYNFFVN